MCQEENIALLFCNHKLFFTEIMWSLQLFFRLINHTSTDYFIFPLAPFHEQISKSKSLCSFQIILFLHLLESC